VEVLEQSCRALSSLISEGTGGTHGRRKAHSAGVFQAVVAAMTAHRWHAHFQYEACRALNFLRTPTDGSLEFTHGSGAVAAIIAALTDHSGNTPQLLATGLFALARVGTASSARSKAFVAGGLDIVLRSMHLHAADEGVMAGCCYALATLTAEAQCAHKAVAAGAVEAVVAALLEHAAHACLQRHACRALAMMVFFSSEAATKAVAMGAVKAVTTAMRAHGAHSKLQRAACLLFSRLSFLTANKAILGEAGAIKLVVAAMRKHAADTEVQVKACNALHAICSPPSVPSELMSRKRKADAVAALQAAFKRFQAAQLPEAVAAAAAALATLGWA
jgi:hypothetical protein